MRYLPLIAILLVSCADQAGNNSDSQHFEVTAVEVTEVSQEDFSVDSDQVQDKNDILDLMEEVFEVAELTEEDSSDLQEDQLDLLEQDTVQDTGAPCDCPAAAPRWVLRDKDGVEVNPLLDPQPSDHNHLEIGDDLGPIDGWPATACVTLRPTGTSPVRYSLQTGSPLDCHQSLYPVFFEDPQCTVPCARFNGAEDRFYLVEGELMYAAGVANTNTIEVYKLSSDGCETVQITSENLWSLKNAPPTITNILGNPPYSLSLEGS